MAREPKVLCRARRALKRQAGITAGAVTLLVALIAVGPTSGGSASGPYEGARLTCAVTAKLAVAVTGAGFPGLTRATVEFRSLGKVLVSTTTSVSATGTFSVLLGVPAAVLSGEVTARAVAAGGSVVRASCSVTLRL